VSLGDFQTHQNLGDAIRVFGKPTTRHAAGAPVPTCFAYWAPLGLTMRFLGRSCFVGSVFIGAGITGRNWQTVRRLRVGDSEARLHALYPAARKVSSSTLTETWTIFQRDRGPAQLLATTRHGKVAAFTLVTSSTDSHP
jgi:hypothetical protein